MLFYLLMSIFSSINFYNIFGSEFISLCVILVEFDESLTHHLSMLSCVVVKARKIARMDIVIGISFTFFPHSFEKHSIPNA